MRTLIRTLLLLLGVAGAYLLWRNQQARQHIQTYIATTRGHLQDTHMSSALRENTQRVVDHAQHFLHNAQRTENPVEDSSLITQRILSALGHESALADVPKINVNVEGAGIAYLRGVVHKPAQRQRAEQIARRTQGVKMVVNLLELEPGA